MRRYGRRRRAHLEQLHWDHVLVGVGRLLRHVQIQHVRRNDLVVLLIAAVLDEEDGVKATQDGGVELNILVRFARLVVGAENGVCGGQHCCARIEHGAQARLGDGDGLLLHGLVDGHLIRETHLVELICG